MDEKRTLSLWKMLRRDIVPLLKLNLVFVLCCLPLLSIPAAVQAMTKINLSLIREKGTDVVPDFLEAFRDEFFDALLCGIIVGALALLFGYVAWFYQQTMIENNLALIFVRYATVLPLLILYCACCYLWPINILADLPRRARLKDALYLTLICIRSTLLCLLFGGLFGAVAIFGIPWSTPFLFVGAFSLWNYISTYYALPMIELFVVS